MFFASLAYPRSGTWSTLSQNCVTFCHPKNHPTCSCQGQIHWYFSELFVTSLTVAFFCSFSSSQIRYMMYVISELCYFLSELFGPINHAIFMSRTNSYLHFSELFLSVWLSRFSALLTPRSGTKEQEQHYLRTVLLFCQNCLDPKNHAMFVSRTNSLVFLRIVFLVFFFFFFGITRSGTWCVLSDLSGHHHVHLCYHANVLPICRYFLHTSIWLWCLVNLWGVMTYTVMSLFLQSLLWVT